MANIQGQQPDCRVLMEELRNVATQMARAIANDPVLGQGNRIPEALDELRQGAADLQQQLHEEQGNRQQELHVVQEDFRRELHEVQADLWREIQENRQDIAGLGKQLVKVQGAGYDVRQSEVVVREDLGTAQTDLAAVRTDLIQESQRLRAQISRQ